MELSDAHIIDALLAGLVRPRRSTPEKAKAPAPRPAKVVSRARCACGQCTICKENQRWEAIYNAKFADPQYYAPRPIKHSSSLNWAR